MCTDMSGFSRVCKEEGILHFLSLVKTMQAIMVPICESYGGQLVKVAADNLFVVFETPLSAVEASIQMQAVTKVYNEGKGRNDVIKLSFGLAHGPVCPT